MSHGFVVDSPTEYSTCTAGRISGDLMVSSLHVSKYQLSIFATLALEFDPDRFLDKRLHKYLVPKPFIFLPFNAGPRICLGQQVMTRPLEPSIVVVNGHCSCASLHTMKPRSSSFACYKHFPAFRLRRTHSPRRLTHPKAGQHIPDSKKAKRSGSRLI